MGKQLELQIINQTTGILETNISDLELFVENKLLEYDPSKYEGDAESAKADRAVLNNSKKALTQERISIVKELMKPYQDFEIRCKALEKKIDEASSKLDEIVKAKEQIEKDEKKQACLNMWNTKNFDLFPMDKVFNPKWLNKTVKMNDVSAEMDEIIKKTYSDLKIIERYGEDAETLKALYLEDLNLEEVFSRGEELQKNRERIAREAETRAERDRQEKLREQVREVEQDERQAGNRAVVSSLLAELDEKPVVIEKDYVLSFKATNEQIIAMKKWLSDNNIIYDSLNELVF